MFEHWTADAKEKHQSH